MGIKVLHKHHCKVTFLIKDGDYLPIESSFVTKKIAEIIKKYKDSYVEENFKKENVTASQEEIIKLQKTLFDVTFGDYLADKATSEGSYKKNVIYYSKLEEILFNDLKNANEKDKSPSPTVKVFRFSLKLVLLSLEGTLFRKNINNLY
jgi:hypothetical protein